MLSTANKYDLSSYVIMFSIVCFMFAFNLIWGFLAGISAFILVSKLKVLFSTKYTKNVSHKLTVGVLAFIVFIVISVLSLGSYKMYTLTLMNITDLYSEIITILNQLKNHLPEEYSSLVPDDIYQLKDFITTKMHNNMPNMISASQNFFKGFIHIIIGLIIGSIVALSSHSENSAHNLSYFLTKRFVNFKTTFSNVVSAQFKISSINTILTAIYLYAVPHLFGFSFPYFKTLIALTFVFGLLPAVGNLITNTLIFLIALTLSLKVAAFSLLYLVVVHKLEYYFNAHFIGSKLNTAIWELLVAMVVFETIFGITGLAISPILYGYLKFELEQKSII